MIPSQVQCDFPDSHSEIPNISSQESLFDSLTDNSSSNDSYHRIHVNNKQLEEGFLDRHNHLIVGIDSFKDQLAAFLTDNNMHTYKAIIYLLYCVVINVSHISQKM